MSGPVGSVGTSAKAASRPRLWVFGRPEKIGLVLVLFALGLVLVAHLSGSGAPTAVRHPPAAGRPVAERANVAPGDRTDSRYAFLAAHIGQEALEEWGKDIFSVRLSRKISRGALEEIFREIRANKPANKRTGLRNRRTVIFFYLPEVDARGPDGPFGGAWALADTESPSGRGKEIEILGFTIDEEIKFVAKHDRPNGNMLGSWIDDSLMKTMYFIYQRDGRYYFGHGGSFEQELVGFGPEPLRLFERKERSRAGDYYRINDAGNLELRDDEGVVAVGRRVQ